MANGTVPIVRQKARINFATWAGGAAANTATDGTGTVVTPFTAGGANDSICDYVKVKHLGTNVVSCARFFINNGSTNATAGNNSFFGDLTLPANAVSLIAASSETLIMQFDLLMPTTYKINVAVATQGAGGWAFTGVGADL